MMVISNDLPCRSGLMLAESEAATLASSRNRRTCRVRRCDGCHKLLRLSMQCAEQALPGAQAGATAAKVRTRPLSWMTATEKLVSFSVHAPAWPSSAGGQGQSAHCNVRVRWYWSVWLPCGALQAQQAMAGWARPGWLDHHGTGGQQLGL